MEEVDNLIKALAVHISEIISSGKEREHEVVEETKALAALMSARAQMQTDHIQRECGKNAFN